MTNEIQILNNVEFGDIRAIKEDSEILFCAMDICRVLGFANPRQAVSTHVDAEDVHKRDTLTQGGMQELTYISESGVYALIFGSKLDSAKRFKHWVTKEVLPSLRKTGTYSLKPMTQAEMNLSISQVQVEQERKINALAVQQSLFDDELKSVTNEITEIKDKIRDNGFISVMGFANNYKISIGQKKGAEIGRMASRWCKQMGILPEKVKHERYGKVNTYPTQALKDVFKAIYPNKSRLFDVPTLWD